MQEERERRKKGEMGGETQGERWRGSRPPGKQTSFLSRTIDFFSFPPYNIGMSWKFEQTVRLKAIETYYRDSLTWTIVRVTGVEDPFRIIHMRLAGGDSAEGGKNVWVTIETDGDSIEQIEAKIWIPESWIELV